MKMTASLLALACAATLPLASVAHAATPESATTVSAAQSQTILEVSASGKLSEIGVAVLGPDVRLIVRLHGPIAFDVDTANFASLEIYGDDAAATLTISEPTAYDRLTAVSFPKVAPVTATTALTTATAEEASSPVTLAAPTGNITIDNDYITAVDETTPDIVVDAGQKKVTWTAIPSGVTGVTIAEGYTLVLACDVSGTKWNCGRIKTAKQRTADNYTTETSSARLVLQYDGMTIGTGDNDFIYRAFDNTNTTRFCGTLVLEGAVKLNMEQTRGGKIGYLTGIEIKNGATLRLAGGTTATVDQDSFKYLKSITISGTGVNDTGAIQFDHANGGCLLANVTLAGDATVNVTESMGANALSGTEWTCGTHTLTVVGSQPLNFGTSSVLHIDSGKVTGAVANGSATIAGGSLEAPVRLPAVITATNENPIKFTGTGDITGACVFTGDVSVEESLTLLVPTEGASLWTIDGSLMVAEGKILTVGIESAETEITEPRSVISAANISGTVALADGLPEGTKLTATSSANRKTLWLTGSGTIRPAEELSGNVQWSTLKTELVDNADNVANLGEASSLVLTFAANAQEGSSLTIDESLTLGSLAINNKSINPVSIMLGEGGSLTVANQITVAGGKVELPISTLFSTSSTASDLQACPAIIIADGGELITGSGSTEERRYENVITGPGTLTYVGSGTLTLRGLTGKANVDDAVIHMAGQGGTLKLTRGGNQQSGSLDTILASAKLHFSGNVTLFADKWTKVDGVLVLNIDSEATVSVRDNNQPFYKSDGADSASIEVHGAGTLKGLVAQIPVTVSDTATYIPYDSVNASPLNDVGNITIQSGATLKADKATLVRKGGDLILEAGAIVDRTGGYIDIGEKTLTLPESGVVTVKVAEGTIAGAVVLNVTGADTTKAKKFTTNVVNTYVTAASGTGFVLGRMTTADTDGHNPALGSKLANILAEAQADAIENGVTSVNLVYGTCGGETLTAEKAEAGVQLFKNVVTTTTEGTTTTVTVAYDFGISKMAIRDIGETRYVIVGAKVQGAEDATTAADFADGTTVQVSVNGKVKTAEAVAAADVGETAEAGVKWFRLPYADVVGADTGTFSLTVKALPQATTP